MTIAERVKAVTDKIAVREQKKAAVVEKYKQKEKAKALTTAERLDRIEEMLGIKSE